MSPRPHIQDHTIQEHVTRKHIVGRSSFASTVHHFNASLFPTICAFLLPFSTTSSSHLRSTMHMTPRINAFSQTASCHTSHIHFMHHIKDRLHTSVDQKIWRLFTFCDRYSINNEKITIINVKLQWFLGQRVWVPHIVYKCVMISNKSKGL